MSKSTNTFSGEGDVVGTLLLFSTVAPKEDSKGKRSAEGVTEHPVEPIYSLCAARAAVVGREKRSRDPSHVTPDLLLLRPSKADKTSTEAAETSLVIESSDQSEYSLSEPSSSEIGVVPGGPMTTITTAPASGAPHPAATNASPKGHKEKIIRWNTTMDEVLMSVTKDSERCNVNGANNDLLSISLPSSASGSGSGSGDEASVSSSHSSAFSGCSDQERLTKIPYDWKDIASKVQKQIGIKVTSDQCWQRYIRYLDPRLDNFANRNKPWTNEEDKQLEIYTKKSMFEGQRSGINWNEVCRLIRRPYVECRSRQRYLYNSRLAKGPFNPADDDNILTLIETGHSYPSIGKMINRSARSVRERYRCLISILHLDSPNGVYDEIV